MAVLDYAGLRRYDGKIKQYTGDLVDTVVEVTDTQPVDLYNKIWIETSEEDVELAEMSDVDKLESAVSESIPQQISHYFVGTSVNKTKTNVGSGDKVIVFGDSIADGSAQLGRWTDYFATDTGVTIVKKAVQGAVFNHNLASKPEEYWISTQIDGVSQAEWADCKLVIVAAGTNDAGNGTTDSDLITYVDDAITKIVSNTNAHILFITPIRRDSDDDSVNKKLPKVSGIIENQALKNQCSVICGFDFPIPTSNLEGVLENFTADGLHPNETGNRVYAQSVINAIY